MENSDNRPKTTDTGLHQELERLNNSRFMRMHNSVPHLLLIQLIKGLALGLGTVIGATLVVSLAVTFLTNIDFIPIIGEWAAQIAVQMNQTP